MTDLLHLVGEPMTCREAVARAAEYMGLSPIPETAWEGAEGWVRVEAPVLPCTVAALQMDGHPHVAALVDPGANLWATAGRWGFMLQRGAELGRPTAFYRRTDWPAR